MCLVGAEKKERKMKREMSIDVYLLRTVEDNWERRREGRGIRSGEGVSTGIRQGKGKEDKRQGMRRSDRRNFFCVLDSKA